MSEPKAKLVEPVAEQAIPDAIDKALSFPDFFSLGHWVYIFIDQVSGVNPAEWIAKEFAGNWEAVAKAGDALKNLSKFHDACAAEIERGSADMLNNWEGNAASAAGKYFDELPQSLREQISALEKVGEQFEQAAYGVWATAKTVVSLLELLFDLAIGFVIEAAATAAASWTGIGAIAGGSAMLLTVARAIQVWMDICKYHGMAWNLCTGTTGIIAGLLGNLHGFKDHPLPAGAYDHPGA